MADDARFEALSIRSDPMKIRDARRWLASIAEQEGFCEDATREVAVALSEACANVHRHAYSGRSDGRIDVEVEVLRETMRVSVRDYGETFDPSSCPLPNLARPGEGGYGIFLMKSLMDHVEYVTTGVGTRVVMVKCRRPHERAPETGGG
jgi:serine/threonine-protein kinase RsbW